MRIGVADIPIADLTALRFSAETFPAAARIAVQHRIRLDAPGRYTLIIRATDAGLFQALTPVVERIMDS